MINEIPLQSLIDYFNDRYAQQYKVNYRPLSLKGEQVTGRFGPVQINSLFSPVRLTENDETFIGHIAQINFFNNQPTIHSGHLLTNLVNQPDDLINIVNFDRLCRMVHLLNYLSVTDHDSKLFLDVDPRHILAIKFYHGLFFEEVLLKCGLRPENIVISMSLNSQYQQDIDQLVEGLNNYRRRGYLIALVCHNLTKDCIANDLLIKAIPHYLRIKAPKPVKSVQKHEANVMTELSLLREQFGEQIVYQEVENSAQASVAKHCGIKYVQGSYYDGQALDCLSCL